MRYEVHMICVLEEAGSVILGTFLSPIFAQQRAMEELEANNGFYNGFYMTNTDNGKILITRYTHTSTPVMKEETIGKEVIISIPVSRFDLMDFD